MKNKKGFSISRVFPAIAHNVFSLCVRAGFGVQNCQPAPLPNRSTKLELTTSARMTQNEC
jgi:hypothetical protein